VARARLAVKTLRVLLAAAETMLSAIEALLGESSSDGLALRRALDDLGSARHAADDALLGATEVADPPRCLAHLAQRVVPTPIAAPARYPAFANV
jgi:hypothetical protein